MLDFIHEDLTISAGIGILLCIFALILLILPVVLFFKIWIMTNDVNRIKELLESEYEMRHPYTTTEGGESNEEVPR